MVRREVSGGDYDELVEGTLGWLRAGDSKGKGRRSGKARYGRDDLLKCTYLGGSVVER